MSSARLVLYLLLLHNLIAIGPAVPSSSATLAIYDGINGTHGFIVGTELQPGALDVSGLKDLIARAGNRK